MSTVRRLVESNVAGVLAVAVNLGMQVLLVPLFLHALGAEGWATWIAFVTAAALLLLIDNAHLDYLGAECMQLPLADRDGRSAVLADGLPAIWIAGALELMLIVWLVFQPWVPAMFDVAPGSPDVTPLRAGLLGYYVLWLLVQAPVNLLGRVIGSLGHYPKQIWWYMILTLTQGLLPAAAVLLGWGLRGALAAFVMATLATNIVNGWQYAAIARAEGITLPRPRVRPGLRRFGRGLGLGLAAIVEYLQQAGLRLLLLPVLGATRLVQFATLRTVANVVQQTLNIVSNPIVPELMRYVSARDLHRAGIVFSGMLYAVLLLLCPAVIALQAIIGPVYRVWTLGKVPFDSLAFALLSVSVLFTGLAQASRAVVRGNNLVATQVATACGTAVVLFVVVALAAGRLGLRGAVLGVVAAEAARAASYGTAAWHWMRRNRLEYPTRASIAAIGGVAVTAAFLGTMVAYPGLAMITALLYLPAWGAMNVGFWHMLTAEERATLSAATGAVTARFRSRERRA